MAVGGAFLEVPPGTVERATTARITRIDADVYDIHIDGPWTGEVKVGLPVAGPEDFIVHEIDELWLPEGDRGERTAQVRTLSLFSTFTKLASDLKEKLCLPQLITGKRTAALQCLVDAGIEEISKAAAMKLLREMVDDPCFEHLEAQAGNGGQFGPKVALVAIIAAMFTGPCRGTASAPGVPVVAEPVLSQTSVRAGTRIDVELRTPCPTPWGGAPTSEVGLYAAGGMTRLAEGVGVAAPGEAIRHFWLTIPYQNRPGGVDLSTGNYVVRAACNEGTTQRYRDAPLRIVGPSLAMTASPSAGPGGRVTVRSVDPCPMSDGTANVRLRQIRDFGGPSTRIDGNYQGNDAWPHWEVTIEVPADASTGQYAVEAHCSGTHNDTGTLTETWYGAEAVAIGG
ncbi:hypothetical protein [Actinomycetospora sp. NBC_00405]|uniref:hypothetical protein n=1 Tax=Actinomycetospora sp. NBC_00405 TaxID=2975952 RepID=UPI002E2486B6